jgi:hypothetical protein
MFVYWRIVSGFWRFWQNNEKPKANSRNLESVGIMPLNVQMLVQN